MHFFGNEEFWVRYLPTKDSSDEKSSRVQAVPYSITPLSQKKYVALVQ